VGPEKVVLDRGKGSQVEGDRRVKEAHSTGVRLAVARKEVEGSSA
jgi:hypothetical protein